MIKAELTVLSSCTEYKVGYINHISRNKCQPLIFHLINKQDLGVVLDLFFAWLE